MEQNRYMLNIIKEVLDDIITHRKLNICTCEACRTHIINTTLKNIPHDKYNFSESDTVYTRIQGVDLQLKTDVTKEMLKVIEEIRANPLHK